MNGRSLALIDHGVREDEKLIIEITKFDTYEDGYVWSVVAIDEDERLGTGSSGNLAAAIDEAVEELFGDDK